MNKRAPRLFESLEYTIGILGTQTVIDGYFVDVSPICIVFLSFIKKAKKCVMNASTSVCLGSPSFLSSGIRDPDWC